MLTDKQKLKSLSELLLMLQNKSEQLGLLLCKKQNMINDVRFMREIPDQIIIETRAEINQIVAIIVGRQETMLADFMALYEGVKP